MKFSLSLFQSQMLGNLSNSLRASSVILWFSPFSVAPPSSPLRRATVHFAPKPDLHLSSYLLVCGLFFTFNCRVSSASFQVILLLEVIYTDVRITQLYPWDEAGLGFSYPAILSHSETFQVLLPGHVRIPSHCPSPPLWIWIVFLASLCFIIVDFIPATVYVSEW